MIIKKALIIFVTLFTLLGCESNSLISGDSKGWKFNKYIHIKDDSSFFWIPMYHYGKSTWATSRPSSHKSSLDLTGSFPEELSDYFKESKYETRPSFYWKIPLPSDWKIFNISLDYRPNIGCSYASSPTGYTVRNNSNTSIIGNTGYTTGSSYITPHTASYCDYGNKPKENEINDYLYLAAASQVLNRGGKYFYISKITNKYKKGSIGKLYSAHILYSDSADMDSLMDFINPTSGHWNSYKNQMKKVRLMNQYHDLRRIIPEKLNFVINNKTLPYSLNIDKLEWVYYFVSHPKYTDGDIPTYAEEKEWEKSEKYKELHNKKYFYHEIPRQYNALQIKTHLMKEYLFTEKDIKLSLKVKTESDERIKKEEKIIKRMEKFEKKL
ncbi:hypothetical protein R5P06_07440 [Candidatus Thioglobus autotrophicus]|uniref:hypothetical protein n=1 Tax=Candidatus Thioglobus autotrophicus TaxID=1705394 RepID=UPI00299F4932|nr:hypothetical protein [Candidatus Thioglobus autotrophicus]WPE16377.1 hypothetical protein R5P06_07440 [Candidatus Thioglobus autotrophicus]